MNAKRTSFWYVALATFFITPAQPKAQTSPTAPQLLKPLQVEMFFEKLMAIQMKKFGIPGAIVTITQGNQIVLAKGYGFADWQKKTPVTSDKTLFRVGSVSKLVTATAVMTLVERGKIALHQDIQRYVPNISVFRRFPGALTVGQLLTHTSGLDVTDIGDASKTWQEHIPLQTFVAKHMTPQIVPPGQFHIYTNHGFAWLGAIIESVGKTTFSSFLERQIFLPLGMKSSSFAQPLSPSWMAMLARGYSRSKQGQYIPLPLDYSNVAPADALVTTAQDMGHFMLAHLNGGVWQGKRIFKAHTLQTMHARQFAYHRALEGHPYGFWEEYIFPNPRQPVKYRGLAHTGGQLGFTSKLLLVPELQLGFFICLNRRVGAMRRTVERQFLHQFFSRPSSTTQPPIPKTQRKKRPTSTSLNRLSLAPFAGTYQRYGLPRHSLEKVVYLIDTNTTRTITWQKDGLYMQPYGKLNHIDGLLFQTTRGRKFVAFRQDPNHRVTHFFFDTTAFGKLAWYENPALHRAVLLGLLLLFALNWILWPLEGRRKKQAMPHLPQTLGSSPAKITLLLMNTLALAMVVWCGVEFARVAGMGWDYGLYRSTVLMLYVPYVAGLLTLAMLGWTWWIWKSQLWNVFWRGLYTTTTCACVLFIYLLYHWRLIHTG